MLRTAISLNCTEKNRQELKRMFNKSADEIAAELDIRLGTAAILPKRFVAEGMRGLRDRHRYGKPPKSFALELHSQQFKQIKQPPPYVAWATWDDGSFSETLNVSDAVWWILRKENVQHHQRYRWCSSADPEMMSSKTSRGRCFNNKEQLTHKRTKIFAEVYIGNIILFVWRKLEAKDSQLPNAILNLCNQKLIHI